MTANHSIGGSTRIQLLTVEEVAVKLREHKKTIYRMVWDGVLPWVNTAAPGKRAKIRFREDQLDAFIEDRSRPATTTRRVAA